MAYVDIEGGATDTAPFVIENKTTSAFCDKDGCCFRLMVWVLSLLTIAAFVHAILWEINYFEDERR